MARNGPPQSAAERQRAFRERQRNKQPAANDPDPPDDGGEPPEKDGGAVMQWMVNGLHRAIVNNGNQRYFDKLAKASPTSVLKALTAAATAQTRNALPPGVEIHVQQLVVANAMPTPGVLASPIAAHIAPQRVLIQHQDGEVIDG